MAVSFRGLLGSAFQALALPLAITVFALGPVGCSDDETAPGTTEGACDPIDNPCPRTQVCEAGECKNAQRCADTEEGEPGTCPENDSDGDPLFCEFTFCVEACQDGGLHCPPPVFRCDLERKTCVRDDGTCGETADCPDGQICYIQENADRGQ